MYLANRNVSHKSLKLAELWNNTESEKGGQNRTEDLQHHEDHQLQQELPACLLGPAQH